MSVKLVWMLSNKIFAEREHIFGESMNSLVLELFHIRFFLFRIAVLLIVFFVFCNFCVKLTQHHDEELDTVKYLPDITRLSDLYRILKIDYNKPPKVNAGEYTEFVRQQIRKALSLDELHIKKIENDGMVRPFDPDARHSFDLFRRFSWCEEKNLEPTWDDQIVYCYTTHSGLVPTPTKSEDSFYGNGTLCGQRNMQESRTQLLRRFENVPVFIAHDPLLRFFLTYLENCGPKLSEPINEIDSEFICYLCPRMGVDCVVQNIHSDMKLLAEGKHLPAERMKLTSRFFPQNWLCNLEENYKEYEFVRFHSDGADERVAKHELREALRKNNVKKRVEERIMKMIEDLPRIDRTTARQFFNSLTEMSIVDLIETYYYDYILFGFPFPEPFPEEDPNVN